MIYLHNYYNEIHQSKQTEQTIVKGTVKTYLTTNSCSALQNGSENNRGVLGLFHWENEYIKVRSNSFPD